MPACFSMDNSIFREGADPYNKVYLAHCLQWFAAILLNVSSYLNSLQKNQREGGVLSMNRAELGRGQSHLLLCDRPPVQ